MTDPTNVHEPVPQSAKLTAREKKWIIYDVGNSAFVLLSTAVIPIYAKSLMPADGNIVSAWGYAQTIASLVIALLMPLLGSIADVQGMKIKFFLGFFGNGCNRQRQGQHQHDPRFHNSLLIRFAA